MADHHRRAGGSNEGDPVRLLLLDTCGADGSLALAEGTAVQELAQLRGRTSSERLVPELRGALARVGWSLVDLAAISVVRGPGSFTGVRVGLAVAKALAEGTGLPLLALSRLEVLSALRAGANAPERTAMLGAGRGEVFWRARNEAGVWEEGLDGTDVVVERTRSTDGWLLCEEDLAASVNHGRVIAVPSLTAADGLGLALERWAQREFADVALLDALYLRRTEQEMLERQAAHRARRMEATQGTRAATP